ncbi:MAG: hypothetical protein ACFB8W_17050 [Elainellaceae cyanobacterium]
MSGFKLDSSDILPLAFAGLSLGILTLSLGLFWLAYSFSKLANQPVPTLVQQVDGRTFTVRAADRLHREPEVIRRLISDWAVMTFTWGTLPDEQGTTVDDGVKITGQERVPTSAWEASFALAPDFRDIFLEKMATEVVPDGVFDGAVSAVLVPQHISAPQAAGEGHWQVDLVATRIIFDTTNPAGYTVPFNRTIYVGAIEPPREPLIANASEYQQTVYRMLEGGVQIVEIRPMAAKE